jgi:hypothetical protein
MVTTAPSVSVPDDVVDVFYSQCKGLLEPLFNFAGLLT